MFDAREPFGFIKFRHDGGAEAFTERLPLGAYRIGRDLSCDLVMAVAPAPVWVELTIRKAAIAVTALTAGVFVAGAPLAEGKRGEFGSDIEIRSVGFSMRVEAPGLSASDSLLSVFAPLRTPVFSRALGWALTGLSVVAALGVAAMFAPKFSALKPPSPEQSAPAAKSPEFLLNEGLLHAGLRLKVQKSPDGRSLIVAGVVGRRERGQLQDIVASVRAKTGVQVGFKLQATEGVDVTIRAVSLKPRVFVVDGQGVQYQIGAIMSNGWELKSVAKDGIMLAREGVNEFVALR